MNGLLLGGMFGLMALGLSLMFGVLKLANFAYGTIYMVGAYVGYEVATVRGLGFWWGIAGSFAVVFVIGIILQTVLFGRVLGAEERVVLLGLGLMLLGRGAILRVYGSQNRILSAPFEGSVQFGGIVISTQRIVTFLLALLLFAGVWLVLNRTPLGLQVRSVSEDPERAQLLGVNRFWIYTATFAGAAGIAAVAATLLSTSLQVSPTVDESALLLSFVIVVLAGMGSIGGTLVGGLIVGVMNTLGAQYVSQIYAPMFPYVLLLSVLLLRPQGLFGTEVRST